MAQFITYHVVIVQDGYRWGPEFIQFEDAQASLIKKMNDHPKITFGIGSRYYNADGTTTDAVMIAQEKDGIISYIK